MQRASYLPTSNGSSAEGFEVQRECLVYIDDIVIFGRTFDGAFVSCCKRSLPFEAGRTKAEARNSKSMLKVLLTCLHRFTQDEWKWNH